MPWLAESLAASFATFKPSSTSTIGKGHKKNHRLRCAIFFAFFHRSLALNGSALRTAFALEDNHMNNRITGFDGLRAIAVLMVFFQHRLFGDIGEIEIG